VPTAIFAHRGSSFHHAEQSLESFTAAIEEGADGIECDVRITSDGVAFCWHDRDLQRLTGQRVPISKVTSNELKKTIIQDRGYVGTPVSFEELAKLSTDSKTRLLVETKHPVLSGSRVEEEVARIAKKYRVDVQILSFAFTAVKRAAELLPESEHVQLIQHARLLPLAQTKIIGVDIELIRKDHTLIDSLRKQGKKIYVWTVNDDAEFESLEKKGVAGIITDIPAQAKKVLGYP
jgi:glycerophosphoryl diester phosphodiesterase